MFGFKFKSKTDYAANANVVAANRAGKPQAQQPQHPLTVMHHKQIAMRPIRRFADVYGVWGLTWNIRKGSAMLRPLGSTSAMVMSYHPNPESPHGVSIELRCVTATMDSATGVISYNDIRMSHDFRLPPMPGALRRQLDPRYEADPAAMHGKPNESWVLLALELDHFLAIRKRTEADHQMKVEPMLPEFFAGFPAKFDLPAGEPQLPVAHWVARKEQLSYQQFTQLTPDARRQLVLKHWDGFWKAPTAPDNTTGQWLIHVDMLERPQDAPQIFEDFTLLANAHVLNPARIANTLRFENPVRAIAAQLGIDLDAMLAGEAAVAAEPVAVEGDLPFGAARGTVVEEVVEEGDSAAAYKRLFEAVASHFHQTYRPMLTSASSDQILAEHRGAATTDADAGAGSPIERAILNPDAPIVVENVDLSKIPVQDAIAACRAYLCEHRPWLYTCVTDEEIAAVLATPQAPLQIAKLCTPQVIKLNMALDVEDAFNFSQLTARHRTAANLWAGRNWMPKS